GGERAPPLGRRDEDADPEHREQRAAGELRAEVDRELALEEPGRRPGDRGERHEEPSAPRVARPHAPEPSVRVWRATSDARTCASGSSRARSRGDGESVRSGAEPLAGLPGRTTYADGAARIETGEETITVRPPFGLAHARVYERVELGPLFEALAEDHVVGALLVRLGGYAVGVFEGERLVASKVGSRFLKGRHQKGGSPPNPL